MCAPVRHISETLRIPYLDCTSYMCTACCRRCSIRPSKEREYGQAPAPDQRAYQSASDLFFVRISDKINVLIRQSTLSCSLRMSAFVSNLLTVKRAKYLAAMILHKLGTAALAFTRRQRTCCTIPAVYARPTGMLKPILRDRPLIEAAPQQQLAALSAALECVLNSKINHFLGIQCLDCLAGETILSSTAPSPARRHDASSAADFTAWQSMHSDCQRASSQKRSAQSRRAWPSTWSTTDAARTMPRSSHCRHSGWSRRNRRRARSHRCE